ncbi:putative protein kinase [Leptomonas seymouri]|uniref:Protein kinase domain-containing protein n=1 Tax=Leptomonas seymouri TaxID=5684 RepID=A0A0N1PAR4_LEPSE|nr:putative protein kinase [Leptomonas seymouri]|eukprot:KPI85151.1 putative protein kinase [Leptomonas seymouri]
MNTSPTAPHFSPDAAQSSEASHFECPRCHRRCKSRTWFLRHLETCFQGSSSTDASPTMNSLINVLGEANAGPSPALQQQQQHHHHNHRASRRSGTNDATSLLVFESVTATSPASSLHSYHEAQKRRNSRPNLVGGYVGNDDAHQDFSDSSMSPNMGASCASALAFSFKQTHTSDASQAGSMVKSFNGNAGDTSSRALHGYHSSINPASNINDEKEGGGSGAPPGLSNPAGASQGSSTYVCSPLGVRAVTSSGESGPASYPNQRPAVRSAATAAAASMVPGHQGAGSAEEVSPRQALARQGSFRLHSNGTWTQYTPTTSSLSSDAAADAGLNSGDSFLGQSSRRSSQSLSRSVANDAGNAHHQLHPHRRSNSNSRQHYGRDAGSLPFNAGGRQVSPAGPDVLNEQCIHERNGSRGSSRNVSASGTGGHLPSGISATSSLPREQERLIPRIMMGGAVGDPAALDPKGSGADVSSGIDGNANGERLSRSQHGSASSSALSRMPSSASPIFAQAMVSPMTGHMSASLSSWASGGRLSGVNGNGGGGGSSGPSVVRTPRQNERGVVVTPRAISFQRGRAVGSGGFGTVYQVILSDGSLAAVKELKLENTNLKAIDREVRAMSGIPPHPNCVRYLGSRYSAHHYYIIMEYISGGSINSLRKSVGRFRESVFQRYAYMVLLGLSHLHSHGIVHRDIKGANVLLDESGCAKIVDFGCSRDVKQASTTLTGGGTPLWMAPEVCRGEPATEKSDVWAFGCLCLEMTNSTGLPWSFPANITLQGVVYALACATASPPIPADLSPEAQDFLQQCLKIDAGERATVAELLRHPFFDVDLMGDSDEGEMLSSCPQSEVKRVVQQVRRNRIRDARVADSDDGYDSANGNDKAACASPLLPGLAFGARSPRTNVLQKNSGSNGNGADLISASQTTHSKSPSGPRLDHYPRSVNVGFSLQAIDDGDDGDVVGDNNAASGGQPQQYPNLRAEVGGAAAAVSEEPSVFDSKSYANEDAKVPSVAPFTGVLANRVLTSSVDSVANLGAEDEDEDTHMITEIITQAREAYTEEERRMTEQRRRRNDMYPSSDDGSFGDCSSDTSAGHAGINRGERRSLQPFSSASSEATISNDDDVDSPGGTGGTPQHKLGSTWRSVRCPTSTVVPVSDAHPQRGGNTGKNAESQQRSMLSAQTLPNRLRDRKAASLDVDMMAGTSEGGAAASSPHNVPQSKSVFAAGSPEALPAQKHADPQGFSLAGIVNPLASSLVVGGPQSSQRQPLQLPSTAASSSGAHCQPPRHHTPTSLASLQSSAFREAAPKEAVRDTRPSMSAMTPPKGVVATLSGMPVSSSEPGGPGRSSALLQPCQHLSPSFPQLSTAATPSPSANAAVSTDLNHSSATGDGYRSPRTPQLAQALTVGGPRRQSSQGPALLATSLRHSPNNPSVEWYTGGSGRLERTVTWQTGASADQPKELSLAQKEMEDMLDWGRGSDRLSSTLSSSSPGTLHRSCKDHSDDSAGEYRGAHRHRERHCRDEGNSQSPAAVDPVKGLSSAEKVKGKRRHLGLGIFRSRKSK